MDLAKTAEDERVRAVCLVAVLDRAGLKPIDYDPSEEKAEKPKLTFDPRAYSSDELEQIEIALKLLMEARTVAASTTPAGLSHLHSGGRRFSRS